MCGIVIEHGYVYEAAPICKYMIGWTRVRASNYCKIKGWRARVIKEREHG